MLCGMSPELAYKASLVAIGREVKTTHNPVWLAEQVCFSLSPKEQGLLALLSECVIWEGRYPCPKDEQSLEYFVYLHYENLFRKVRTGNLTILEPVEPNPLGWEVQRTMEISSRGIRMVPIVTSRWTRPLKCAAAQRGLHDVH
jgi:hypothetical protein